MKNSIPKVLIFSHNPISYMTGNGKTLATFFYAWPSANVAQIYTSDMSLDYNICCSYWHISEKKLIKNILKKDYVGEVAQISQIKRNGNEIKYSIKKIYPVISKFFHTWAGRIIREYAWRRNFLKNNTFDNWIRAFAPDVLVFTMGELFSEYDFIQKIANKYCIPIILYASDNYLENDSHLIFSILQKNKLYERYMHIKNQSPMLIAISDAMAVLFKEKYGFHNKIIVAMNCCNHEEIVSKIEPKNFSSKILYTGNLGLGRWQVIESLANKMHLVDLDYFSIHIYSSFSVVPNARKKLGKLKNVCMCGNATHAELIKLRADADILLIIESFDLKYKNILSTAISTKVPEYLASGKPILAIGPSYSASIAYIDNNNAGYCVTQLTLESIEMIFRQIKRDIEMSNYSRIENALHLAKERHDKQQVSNVILENIKIVLNQI